MVTELEIDLLPPAFDYLGADVEMSAELRDELNPYADGLPTEVQDQLTERYKEIFGLFLKHQDKISRVTFWGVTDGDRSEEHTSELQSRGHLVCRLLLEKKN